MEQDFLQRRLSIIKDEIEKKKGLGDFQSWRYSQFKELAKEVSNASEVKISHTTLIRILKSPDTQTTPQISTLKALVNYIGYASWEAFNKHLDAQAVEVVKYKPLKKQRAIPKKASWGYTVMAILVVGALLLIWYFNKIMEEGDHKIVELKLLNSNTSYPQPLNFKYRVPEGDYYLSMKPKSLQPYYMDHLKWPIERLLRKEDSVTSLKIELPGNYIIAVTKENEMFTYQDIQLYTEGWLCVIQSKERSMNKKKFKNIIFQPALDSGMMKLPKEAGEHIWANQIERVFEPNFFLIQDFGINPNDIVFETKIRNIHKGGGVSAQLNRVTLLTEYGLIEVPLVNKSNNRNVQIWFSDYKKTYRAGSMEQYIQEPANKWVKLRIEIADFTGKVFVNDKLIDTITYNEPLGELTGIRYKFINNGEVDYCGIFSHQGDTLYHEDFKP